MRRPKVQSRVSQDVKLAIEKLMEKTGLSESALVEELLVQALSEQDTELATTFLVPKLEAMMDKAMDQYFQRTSKLQARAALQATMNTQLLLAMYQVMHPKADESILRQVLQESRRIAHDSMTRRNKDVEAVLDALMEVGADITP